MIGVPLVVSDKKIWNRDEFWLLLFRALHEPQDITIDLLFEGPDFEELGITDMVLKLCAIMDRDPKTITVKTCNYIQKDLPFQVDRHRSVHLLEHAVASYQNEIVDKDITHAFGFFVFRNNPMRLWLASHLYRNHPNKTLMTFNFDVADDMHQSNVCIDDLVKETRIKDITAAADLISNSPILASSTAARSSDQFEPWLFRYTSKPESDIVTLYNNFAIDIVVESYYSGHSFFPTEKIWRPMLMRTPFIVQGPQGFLSRLHDMGFQTFNRWWDEGYAEDPGSYQPQEIIKVIDRLAQLDVQSMLEDMKSTLEHNRNRVLELVNQGHWHVRP